MRDAVREEIENAANEFEAEALALRPDHNETLIEVYKEIHTANIMELANKYLPLKIAGPEDKAGFNLVYGALQDVKGLRVKTDKLRKETNETAQKWIRTNNEEARRLTNLLAPVETHLQAERDRYEAEIEAIKAEKQRKVDERNQGRVDALLAVGASIALSEVVLMSDETFGSYLALATKAFEEAQRAKAEAEAAEKAKVEAEAAEVARKKAEEEAARAAERKQIAEERARIEAERAELKAAQDALEAQRRETDRAAKEEQARKDTEARIQAEAARVIQEAKEKADRDALAETQHKAAEEARRLAAEAARPDADKLIALANAFDQITFPDMATPAGRIALAEITQAVDRFCKFIETKAKGLTEYKP